MSRWRQLLGAGGERAAEAFLRRRQYRIVGRNYRCPEGEIDLIALDDGVVVFIEVKTRRGAAYGMPIEAVDGRKRRHMKRAARHYIARHRLEDRLIRFDVVGVTWCDGQAQCELFKDVTA